MTDLPAARAYVLAAQAPVKIADLQRELRCGRNEAAAALEAMESAGILGSILLGGIRAWHPSLPVDRERQAHLRRYYPPVQEPAEPLPQAPHRIRRVAPPAPRQRARKPLRVDTLASARARAQRRAERGKAREESPGLGLST